MKNRNGDIKLSHSSFMAKKATSSIEKSFRSSMFYNFFRSHRTSEKRFANGFFGSFFASTKLYTSIRTIKNSFAQTTETSFVVSILRSFYEKLLLCKFRNYVSVLLYFSIYALAVSTYGYTLGNGTGTTVSGVYSSLVMLVISLVLMPLKGSLKDIVTRSKLLSHISDIFFMPVSFSKNSENYIQKTHTAATMVIGTILGLLTSVVPMSTILSVLLIAFLVLSFFKTPENSLPVLIVYGMFASPSSLSLLCLFAFGAYMFKVLRGKRNLELKYFDVLYLLFVVIIALGGLNITGNGYTDGYTFRTISYLLVYFIFRNCVKNDSGSKKIINSMVLCSMIGSLIIIYSRFYSWGYFDVISKYSGFHFKPLNFDLFSICGFILLIFPFVLSSMTASKNKRGKLFALVTAFISMTALLSTGIKGLIIGVAVCVLIFVVSSFRNPFVSLLTVLIVYVILSVLVTNAPFLGSDRFLSISDYTKSISFTTSEIISDNFVGGIGFGAENFSEVYGTYTHYSEKPVLYSNNIFLHALACFGVFGSLFMVLLFLNYYKMQFTSISENRNSNFLSSIISISAISSVSTLLLRGLTDYPLSNHRVTFMLFALIGFSSAIYYRNTSNYDTLYEE